MGLLAMVERLVIRNAVEIVAHARRGASTPAPVSPEVDRMTEAPERATISCSAATCCSKAARPARLRRAEVRGRLPTNPLRIST